MASMLRAMDDAEEERISGGERQRGTAAAAAGYREGWFDLF